MKRPICWAIAAVLMCATLATAVPYRGALVYIDRPPAGTASRLLEAGAVVVRNAGSYLLAVVDEAPMARLEQLRLPYRLLDPSVAGNTYFTVSRATEDRAGRLGSLARVLHVANGTAVVEGPPQSGNRLAQAGFDVQRVFMRPVVPPRRPDRPVVTRASTQPDPLIQEMLAAVSGAVIDGYVQRLQDFVSRWALHDSCQAAADWIEAELVSFSLDSVAQQEFSTFYKGGNVVAVLPGATTPEQIIVVGGHYDSVSGSMEAAPGADDNASGIACVLQCARILSGYRFDKTVVFIAFGAEEQGLVGSEHYAAQASAAGDDIVAMVNADMLGYLAPGDDLDVDVVGNAASQWLRDRAFSVAALYVPETPAVAGSLLVGASDHVSFWDQGYSAIMIWEDTDQPSPYIHSPADTIGLSYNHPHLAEQSTRMVVALAADLAGPLGPATAPGGAPTPAVSLAQNVPNPFNPRTAIRFTVAPPGALASLEIYDVSGREVASLLDGDTVAGTRTVWWNGTTDGGNPVASGVYFYRLTAGRQVLTRKMVLVR